MERVLLIATNNPHKVEEIRTVLKVRLGDRTPEIWGAADFPHITPPEETGTTFEQNAILKAAVYAQATGLVALADDSGLCIEELAGGPGVHSARYAPTNDERIARVLKELEGLPPDRREAWFECVVALARPGRETLTRRGILRGRIAHSPRGNAGFGYDPIFELTEPPFAGRTLAELGADVKNALSHRARALEAIAPLIADVLDGKE